MIRLTYIHWHSGERGAMLLNPTATLAITPSERNGVPYSQIAVQGYTYSVAETIDEIEALITPPATARKAARKAEREAYFAGANAAHNEAADLLEKAGVRAYAEYFRARAGVSALTGKEGGEA